MCKIGPFLQIDDNMQMRLLTSLVKYSKTFQFKGFHKKNTTTKGGWVGTRQYKYYYNTVCTKFEIKHEKTMIIIGNGWGLQAGVLKGDFRSLVDLQLPLEGMEWYKQY